MTKIINVVGAILIKEGKILCAQRGGEKSLPYLWEFPGGKIEQGETPQEALHRELIEELKIEVVVSDEIFDVTRYNRSEEHTSELQSRFDIVCRLLLEKKKQE